ncbi:U11/U12 small nuclear ribonucleoprotein 25 kDa [Gossypium arboreum]|uniref:U11/U12 small nuclear ribonucleoprotein 25 kDa n=1 Tax=Gossypium arboreum TaxID=29729 RepID=A0A0B0PVI8_GOSAR|nr:U11/U12 small nuclear ribonucleoprotein 25 kDa [Gossypium arboreum]
MCISIVKLDGTFFDVAVMNSATVKDLKLTIKKKVIELEQSKMGHQQISWYIFYLMLSQKVLGDILRGENTISSMA